MVEKRGYLNIVYLNSLICHFLKNISNHNLCVWNVFNGLHYSPSSFKSSSKFSEDFIAHFPEKSAISVSMLKQAAADDNFLQIVGQFWPQPLSSASVRSSPFTGLCSSLLSLHLRLHWLADRSHGFDAAPIPEAGGGEGLSPAWFWTAPFTSVSVVKDVDTSWKNALPVSALMWTMRGKVFNLLSNEATY